MATSSNDGYGMFGIAGALGAAAGNSLANVFSNTGAATSSTLTAASLNSALSNITTNNTGNMFYVNPSMTGIKLHPSDCDGWTVGTGATVDDRDPVQRAVDEEVSKLNGQS